MQDEMNEKVEYVKNIAKGYRQFRREAHGRKFSDPGLNGKR